MSTSPYDYSVSNARALSAKAPRGLQDRRDSSTILQRMRAQALAEGQTPHVADRESGSSTLKKHHPDIGLLLGELEVRWSVGSALSKPFLEGAGLPYEGHRAGIIYSWPTIFKAEGIPEELASNASRSGNLDLFEDLLDTTAAAKFLGYQDSSSIRKLIGSCAIPAGSFITFGSRKVYRIRPAALRAIQRAPIGRIV